MALGSSLGLTSPALVGAVFAALTLLPLIALALRGTRTHARIVARQAPSDRDGQPATAHH